MFWGVYLLHKNLFYNSWSDIAPPILTTNGYSLQKTWFIGGLKIKIGWVLREKIKNKVMEYIYSTNIISPEILKINYFKI